MIKGLLTIRKPNLIPLMVGITMPLELRIFGSLISLFEIISLFFFLYHLIISGTNKIKIFENKIYIRLSLLLFLWSSCQLISDIINKTDFKNSIKGIFVPLLLLFGFRLVLLIYSNLKNRYFIEDILLGYSLCYLMNTFLIGRSIENSLKLGGIFSICLLVYSLFKHKNIHRLLTFILLIVSFFYGARTMLAILSILIISDFFNKKEFIKPIKLNLIQNIFKGIYKFIFIIIIFLALSPISNFFNKAILNFYSNEDRVEVIENQSKGGFFAARIEYFSFFEAFRDSPFFGHGSWSIDDNYKYSILSRRGNNLNKNKSDRAIIKDISTINIELLDESGYPYIPNHSFVQQTLIWAGLFAPFFLFYLFNLTLFSISNIKLPYSISIILIKFIWDIFFSPLGLNRFYLPILCLITIVNFKSINKNFFEINNKKLNS